MYTAIVATENNRITKFAEFHTESEAQEHCNTNGGFVYSGAYRPDLYVTGETVVIQSLETGEQAANRLEAAVDRHLDAVAQSYQYESIRTMVTYATSDHPTFGAEGKAAVKWRDAVYSHCIQVQAEVNAGNMAIPTEAELIAELPVITDYLIV